MAVQMIKGASVSISSRRRSSAGSAAAMSAVDEDLACAPNNSAHSDRPSCDMSSRLDDDAYWPPPREGLQRVAIDFSSIHQPKRGEKRPRFNGSRAACHAYHPELSGGTKPPDKTDPSIPASYGSAVIGPCNYSAVIAAVIAVTTADHSQIHVIAQVRHPPGAAAGRFRHGCLR
eukprot:4166646-Prymnesium_polylepis.2